MAGVSYKPIVKHGAASSSIPKLLYRTTPNKLITEAALSSAFAVAAASEDDEFLPTPESPASRSRPVALKASRDQVCNVSFCFVVATHEKACKSSRSVSVGIVRAARAPNSEKLFA